MHSKVLRKLRLVGDFPMLRRAPVQPCGKPPRVSPIPSFNRWLTLARPRRCYLLGASYTTEEEERVTFRDIINS